jgi:hypothetical protein
MPILTTYYVDRLDMSSKVCIFLISYPRLHVKDIGNCSKRVPRWQAPKSNTGKTIRHLRIFEEGDLVRTAFVFQNLAIAADSSSICGHGNPENKEWPERQACRRLVGTGTMDASQEGYGAIISRVGKTGIEVGVMLTKAL